MSKIEVFVWFTVNCPTFIIYPGNFKSTLLLRPTLPFIWHLRVVTFFFKIVYSTKYFEKNNTVSKNPLRCFIFNFLYLPTVFQIIDPFKIATKKSSGKFSLRMRKGKCCKLSRCRQFVLDSKCACFVSWWE